MFHPDTDLTHSTMYQPQTDHFQQLPSFTATEDHQSTQAYELHHIRDHTYELSNYCSYSSSGCESSPSSYSALFTDDTNKSVFGGGLTQRSVSSHSLPPLINDNTSNNTMAFNYQSGSNVMNLRSTHRLVDLIDSCSVRRVFSTGDLQLQRQQYQLSQQQQGLSSSKESSSSSIIEGMLSKACRYSPEEKKERIERYRTKRSHRNFNKKIKYECRKTLADSRLRIRGRFAKNNNSDNNEDGSLDDKWGGQREYEADDQWENNEDDNWLDLFNAAWLLK